MKECHDVVTLRNERRNSLSYNLATFEEYCEQRWELVAQHANRLIAASAFAQNCQNQLVLIPSRESHIRPLLARLEADADRITVWRDLSAGQKAMIGLAITPYLEAEAKERKIEGGKQAGRARPKKDVLKGGQANHKRAPRVVDQIAKAAGTGHGTISKAKKVKAASPTLAADVAAGRMPFLGSGRASTCVIPGAATRAAGRC